MNRTQLLVRVLVCLICFSLGINAHIYSVDNTDIFRNGVPWIPVGVNALSSYGSASGRVYPENISIVREYIIMNRQGLYCAESGCWAKQLSDGSWLHPLEALLDRNEQDGVVTLVDLHKWNETLELWAKIPSETDFFDDYMTKLVQEYIPFLHGRSEAWLSIWNEPFAWDGSDNVGPEKWSEEMTAILQAVRNAGYTNIVVVPAGQMGQDETVLLGGYAKTLADAYGPVVFDIHCYNRWQKNTPEQLASRLSALKSEGLAILIGETGPSNAGQVLDYGPLLNAAVQANIGVCAWVWKCRSSPTDRNALRAPTTAWCQTWVYNDEDNFSWGSGFRDYLSNNYAPVPNSRQRLGGSLSYSFSGRK